REARDGPAGHLPVAGDERVAGRATLEHPEVRFAVADEAVELDEGAWVAQPLGPLAREQLAGGALLLDRGLGPCVRHRVALLAQPIELRPRRLVRHEREATVAGWTPTARRSGRTTSAANPSGSTTRATHTRPAPPPKSGSGRSRAATRSSTPPAWVRRRRSSSPSPVRAQRSPSPRARTTAPRC